MQTETDTEEPKMNLCNLILLSCTCYKVNIPVISEPYTTTYHDMNCRYYIKTFPHHVRCENLDHS